MILREIRSSIRMINQTSGIFSTMSLFSVRSECSGNECNERTECAKNYGAHD